MGTFALDIDYYLHLAFGQARILWKREPIEKVLDRSKVGSELFDRLHFIQKVKQFSQNEIGLVRSGDFTTLCDIGEGPVSWNLIACPKDHLKPLSWAYPVLGNAPYRGFFDLTRAEKERKQLAEEGYDTYLYPVRAYSTLGWFEDPVLSSMLQYRDEDLADLIIHELTHGTVWVSGNVSFNESLATFVGETGSLLFLKELYGFKSSEVQEVLRRRSDKHLFFGFMKNLARDLETVYRLDISLQEKLDFRKMFYEKAQTQFLNLPMSTDRYNGILTQNLNNARIVAYQTYHKDLDVFERVYSAIGCDLKRAVTIFKRCGGVDDPKAYLEAWLQKL